MQNDQFTVAIVGIGCRLPGGVNHPDELWTLLRDGVDAVSEVPADRWIIDRYYDSDPNRAGKMFSRHGGFLDLSKGWDTDFFGISPREAASIDPQQRLLLEVVWECLEDAGQTLDRLSGKPIGVFVGISSHDYSDIMANPMERLSKNPYAALGSSLAIAANRISYALDLRGPSLAIDTACSSSLVALHSACQSLRSGDSTAAIVAGVNLILKPEVTLSFCNAGMLSPDGRCKSFAAGANGFVRGEGAGVVLLKPLSQALADGDRPYAVILSSCVNQDGRTPGIAVPSAEAQANMLRQAYRQAGVDPAKVTYVEAHGTGTAVGDPIEAMALGTVLGDGRSPDFPCLIGSIKSNLGHLEAGSGIVGIIKTALMLKHRKIVPNLHFDQPNPTINFEALRLMVPTRYTEWKLPEAESRIAGVNSFGFGGTNAHVVLKEWISHEEQNLSVPRNSVSTSAAIPAAIPAHAYELCVLSANSRASLEESFEAHHHWLSQGMAARRGVSLADVAAHLANHRTALSHRAAFVVDAKDKFAAQLENWREALTTHDVVIGESSNAKPNIAFVFSGMGGQWWGMGRELFRSESVFSAKVSEICEAFEHEAGWSLFDEWTKDEASSRSASVAVGQPHLFCLQVATAHLWRSWGIEPAAVLGHSVGEVAAAHFSGRLNLREAVRVIFHRARLQATRQGDGAMLAVHMNVDGALNFCRQTPVLEVAAFNGPQSVTLAGDRQAIEAAERVFERDSRFVRRLHGDIAYHCWHMDTIEQELLASIGPLSLKPSWCEVYSTVSGAVADASTFAREYWWQNVRAPVRFQSCIAAALHRGVNTFLEIGPHPTLLHDLRETASNEGKDSILALGSLRRQEPERKTMLRSVAKLFVAGTVPQIYNQPSRKLSSPLYRWQRTRHWLESERSEQVRLGNVDPLLSDTKAFGPKRHLLGRRIALANNATAWHSSVDYHQWPWLVDHRIDESAIFPASAWVVMAWEAIQQLSPDVSPQLHRIRFTSPLSLDANRECQIQSTLSGDGTWLEMKSQEGFGKPWTAHANLRIGSQGNAETIVNRVVDLGAALEHCSNEVPIDEFYASFSECGLNYGPTFRLVNRIWSGPDEAIATVSRLNDAVDAEFADQIHPAVLDACFQVIRAAAASATLAAEVLLLPHEIDAIIVHQHPIEMPLGLQNQTTDTIGHARVIERTTTSLTADLSVFSPFHHFWIEIRGFQCRIVESGRIQTHRHFEYVWERSQLVKAADEPSKAIAAPEVLKPLESTVDRLRTKYSLEHVYRDISPRAFELSLAWICSALRELGIDSLAGQTLSTSDIASHCKIEAGYLRWLNATLNLLYENRLIERHDQGWTVRKLLIPREPAELWREQMRLFPDYQIELNWTLRVGSHLAEILTGHRNVLEVYFPDGQTHYWEQLFQHGLTLAPYNTLLVESVLQLIRRSNPEKRWRILEVGAGSGAILSQLDGRLPLQVEQYTFSDLSGTLVEQASHRFAHRPLYRFRTLDLEAAPHAQGWDQETYDIIIASDVLHATRDLDRTCRHLRELLASDGHLACMELTQGNLFSHLIFSPLRGWWEFDDDARVQRNSPLLTREQWIDAFHAFGFQAVESIDDARGTETAQHTIFLAQNSERIVKPSDTNPVDAETLVSATSIDEIASARPKVLLIDGDQIHCRDLSVSLRNRRASVCEAVHEVGSMAVGSDSLIVDGDSNPWDTFFARLREQESWPTDIVLMSALACPDTESFSAVDIEDAWQLERVSFFTQMLQALARLEPTDVPRLTILTRGAQAVTSERGSFTVGGGLWCGIARVLANEFPELRTRIIDLQTMESMEWELVADEIMANGVEDEISIRSAHRYVRRYVTSRIESPQFVAHNIVAEPHELSFERLVNPHPGRLDQLRWEKISHGPLDPSEVEISIEASGVNFKDLMSALDMLPRESYDGGYLGRTLGLECAGRVSRIGSQVTHVAVGDRVVACARHSFATHAKTDARFVWRYPVRLSPTAAATLPTAYATAWYGLVHLAKIQPGEKVLIHAATGGVGMAAVYIAQAMGCKIFATAGSDAKRATLRAMGIDHVANSRDSEFAKQFHPSAFGEGVDVVLNSLPGDMMQASIKAMQPSGRFIEIGKRDMLAHHTLDLSPFERNLSYFGVDLDRLMKSHPKVVQEVFEQVMQLVDEGRLPALPYICVPFSRASEGLQMLAQSRHLGKIVFTRDDDTLAGDRRFKKFRASDDGTYIVTGGLTGFGLKSAEWLIERGARFVALLGRRPPDEALLQRLTTWKSQGVRVETFSVDVGNRQELEQVFELLRSDLPKVRGILHAAMAIDDSTLLKTDRDSWRKVLAPKALGAWNLHELTRQDTLDFFVLYSSMAVSIGNPGQANYVAANMLMEELANYRRSIGLPAVSVNWGAIGDAGYVARNLHVHKHLIRAGLEAIPADEALDTLGELLLHDHHGLSCGQMDWRRWGQVHPASRSPRFAHLIPRTGSIGQRAAAEPESLLSNILAVHQSGRVEEAAALIECCVARNLAAVLGMIPEHLSYSKPLTQMGLDSLMAVELHSRLVTELSVSVPTMRWMSGLTIQEISQDLYRQIIESEVAS